MNDAYMGTMPVLKVCLVLAPIGLASYWYATSRLLALTDLRSGRVAYWLFGSIGAVAGGAGGFFGTVAFIVLLFNGLSIWWAIPPLVALIGLIIWLERARIDAAREAS